MHRYETYKKGPFQMQTKENMYVCVWMLPLIQGHCYQIKCFWIYEETNVVETYNLTANKD